VIRIFRPLGNCQTYSCTHAIVERRCGSPHFEGIGGGSAALSIGLCVRATNPTSGYLAGGARCVRVVINSQSETRNAYLREQIGQPIAARNGAGLSRTQFTVIKLTDGRFGVELIEQPAHDVFSNAHLLKSLPTSFSSVLDQVVAMVNPRTALYARTLLTGFPVAILWRTLNELAVKGPVT
jgi:hypothetical protein